MAANLPGRMSFTGHSTSRGLTTRTSDSGLVLPLVSLSLIVITQLIGLDSMLDAVNEDIPDRANPKYLRLFECGVPAPSEICKLRCRPETSVHMYRLGRHGCRGTCSRYVSCYSFSPKADLQAIWSVSPL